MCTYSKYIYNRYLNKSILVSCGKCPACLQQKANARAMRIRNHNYNSCLALFLTLTYDNKFVPYVERDVLSKVIVSDNYYDIPIYRDFSCRWYRDSLHVYNKREIVGYLPSNLLHRPAYSFPPLNKKHHGMGVIVWSDVQRFFKKLRQILYRNGLSQKITYYSVGEYGSNKKSWRPHFHCIVYFRKGSFETLRPLIAKAWPYGDMLRTDRRISIAVDPSSYVASYVTKSSHLPKILETSAIRQKHSHSLFFGTTAPAFSLTSILEKVKRGDCSYRREVLKDGVPVLVELPIPEYVINRFFPKFRGYSAFSPSEVLQLLQFPIYLWNRLGASSSRLIAEEFQYSSEDYRKFVIRLRHAVDYYISITHNSIYDFAIDYLESWRVRSSYVLRHSYDEVSDFTNFYENINDVKYGIVRAPTLSIDSSYQENPNLRKDVVLRDFNLGELHDKIAAQREITSVILSELYDDF